MSPFKEHKMNEPEWAFSLRLHLIMSLIYIHTCWRGRVSLVLIFIHGAHVKIIFTEGFIKVERHKKRTKSKS